MVDRVTSYELAARVLRLCAWTCTALRTSQGGKERNRNLKADFVIKEHALVPSVSVYVTALHAAKYNGLGSNLEHNITPHHLVQKIPCYKSTCKGNSFPIASLARSVLQVFIRDQERRN